MLSRSSNTRFVLAGVLIFLVLSGLLSSGLLAQNLSSLQVPSDTWALTGSMAQSRTAAAAAVLQDGSVLLTGGVDAAGNPLASVDLYGADGKFHAAAAMHIARSAHTATRLADGRVLVAGGAISGGGVTSSAEIYDPAAGLWTLLPGLTTGRAGHTATALPDGDVLIAGGKDASGALASLELFHGRTQAFSAAGNLAAARSALAAAALKDGRVLFVGGTGANGATLASTELYNSKDGSVVAGPALNHARAAASATTLLDGTVLIAGGSQGTVTYLQSAEIFDPAADTITPLAAALNSARAGHLAFLLPENNSVLLAGGLAGGAATASVELYRPWTSAFVAAGSMAAARSQAAGGALAPLANGLLLVAGGNQLASAELFGFPTVTTDQVEYAPGTPVVITGSGWQPGELVNLYLRESPNLETPAPLSATADANGKIQNRAFTPDQNDQGVDFYLTAVGANSQLEAQTLFSDATPFIAVDCEPESFPVNNPTQCTVSLAQHSTCIPADGTTITWSTTTGNLGATTCILSGLSCAVTFTPTTWINVDVTASYPSTTGCSSAKGEEPLDILSTNPVPATTSLSRIDADVFSAGFVLTVNGSNFVTGSLVTFNGATRATTYVSDTQLTAVILAGDLAHAGIYDVLVVNPTPGGGPSNAQTFTVHALTPTLTVTCPSGVVYDGASHTCTGSATGLGGVAVAGSFAFSPTGEINAGTYPVTGTFTSSDLNYRSGGTQTGSLQIAPAALSVTANNQSMIYGATVPQLTCTIVGAVAADSFSCGFNTLPTTPVVADSPYPLTPTVQGTNGTILANYTVTYHTGQLTVGLAVLTVTADSKSMTYGTTIPSLTCSITGAINGDTFTCSFAPIVPAGQNPSVTGSPWAITPTAVTGAHVANYSVHFVNGALTVSQATQTITCNQTGQPINTLPYAAGTLSPCTSNALYALPVTYTVASGKAALTGNGSGVVLTGLGAATLTATQGGDGNYRPAATVNWIFKVVYGLAQIYNCSYSSATLGTGSGLPTTVQYGIAPINFSCQSTSPVGLKYTVGNTSVWSQGRLFIKRAGTVSVVVSQAASALYRKATSVSYQVSVTRAPLTITGPVGLKWVYGNPKPYFTYSCKIGTTAEPVVNGDKNFPRPVATSPVGISSPLGTYPTTCSVSVHQLPYTNYDVHFAPGSIAYLPRVAAIVSSHRNIYFGTSPTGVFPYYNTFTLTNNTGAIVTFTIQPTSANFAPSQMTCTAPRGAVCSMSVLFQPQTSGSYEETLTIHPSDAASDTFADIIIALHGSKP